MRCIKANQTIWHMCPTKTLINLFISLMERVSSADTDQSGHQPSGMYTKCSQNQPGHQYGGMYAQCRLKLTWLSTWWHVCQIQTQINLAISLLACVPSADSSHLVICMVACIPNAVSNQPGHQPSGLCSQCRLKSTWSLAW